MNSLDAASALRPATASFKKYSTALTSWLVVASMVLIRPASCNEKLATNWRKNFLSAADKFGNSSTATCSDK